MAKKKQTTDYPPLPPEFQNIEGVTTSKIDDPESFIVDKTAIDEVPEGYTRCHAVGENTVIWHNVVYTLENESIYTVPTDLFEFLNKSKMVRPVGV